MSEVAIREALNNGMMSIEQDNYIKLPNSEFFIKRDGSYTTSSPVDKPWLRLTLLNLSDSPATMGINGSNKRTGLAQVDIFTPKADPKGDLIAATLADKVRAVFKTGATINGVRISSASSRVRDEQSWYSRVISVDFYIYEQR